jgi:hypothetical protein
MGPHFPTEFYEDKTSNHILVVGNLNVGGHDHGPVNFHAPTKHLRLTIASWHIRVIYVYPTRA